MKKRSSLKSYKALGCILRKNKKKKTIHAVNKLKPRHKMKAGG